MGSSKQSLTGFSLTTGVKGMISVIVPTHNRAKMLAESIRSVLECEGHAEVIVVDNNSIDNTREVAHSFGEQVRYVFEKNTAFTRARATGASAAKGNILVFIDDDVLVDKNALRELERLFQKPECGCVAAQISPKYEADPPGWAVACQHTFNGWSLLNPEFTPWLGCGFQEVSAAYGPMMAIRQDVYDEVGGFPPDTIGIETNDEKVGFRKLYVGPGDYGICHLIRCAGYKIYFSPSVKCFHRIPPARFTVGFWRSRVRGEAHHMAVTRRMFFRFSRYRLLLERLKARAFRTVWGYRLLRRLKGVTQYLIEQHFKGILHEELWVYYYEDYLEIDRILRKDKRLAAFLWELGKKGVSSDSYETVRNRLPKDFLHLVSSERMYSEQPTRTPGDFLKGRKLPDFTFMRFLQANLVLVFVKACQLSLRWHESEVVQPTG
jgi:glycosyltransferase involved in cell wall biosynthesis